MIETSTELTATERKEALERLDMLKVRGGLGIPSLRRSFRLHVLSTCHDILSPVDCPQMSFHIQRREEIQKALFAGMALHHDHMERAHNRYAVSNRHAQHMEAINADDIYAGRVHQLPSFIRAYFQFHTEFDEWNEMNLAQMRAGEGQVSGRHRKCVQHPKCVHSSQKGKLLDRGARAGKSLLRGPL